MSRRPPLQALFLILEAIALAVIAWRQGCPELIPAAGLCGVLGLLAWGRLLWLVLPLSLAPAALMAWRLLPSSLQPSLTGATAQGAVASLQTHAILALVLGVGCAFCGILDSLAKTRPVARVAMLGRLSVALHFLAAGLLLAAPWSPVPVTDLFAGSAGALALLLGADTFLKLIARLYTPRRHWDRLPAPGAVFFFRWCGAEGRACFPLAAAEEESFSLRLGEMWMWPVLRGRLPWLVVCGLLMAWLASALHEVGAGEHGVRNRLGTWDPGNLSPGFHLSLPWPLGGIRRVETGRLYETVLGFRADPGQPILWEKAHYEEEQMSLVGGGDDLLSISVPIHYRIADAAAYLRGAADPGRLVRDAGNRILLDLTVRQPAAAVMTRAREEIRHEFHARLQQQLDAERSGIHIEEVLLRDVHPPVQVAPAFQEVLAAMEDREAALHDGESYRRDYSTRAKADAYQLVVGSRSAAASRLSQVAGDVARFDLRLAAWRESRPLFELREGFRVFDETLGNTKKAIFDERIRAGVGAQLDLRRVLNPDLIDSTPPPPDSLVPRPVRSMDAFDLDIEGVLRMDRGEVPAVNAGPDDPDNLLRNQPSPPTPSKQ